MRIVERHTHTHRNGNGLFFSSSLFKGKKKIDDGFENTQQENIMHTNMLFGLPDLKHSTLDSCMDAAADVDDDDGKDGRWGR